MPATLRAKVKAEASRLRRNRIADYPGGPKVREGLSWENLDEVTDAILAVFQAERGVPS